MEAKAFVEDATEEEQKTSYHVVEGFMEKGLGIEKSIQLYDELSDEYEKVSQCWYHVCMYVRVYVRVYVCMYVRRAHVCM